MASYASLAHFNGSIGDLVFYTYRGKPCVRRKSSMNAERFKQDESFELARQNACEFGGASAAGKLIRKGLWPLLDKKRDGKLAALLTQQCRRLLGMAPGERGKRPVQLCRHAAVLEGLCSEGGTLRVENGSVMHPGPVPTKATHVRAVVRFFTLSDVEYNEATGKYVPVREQKSHTVYSAATPLRGDRNMEVAPHVWGLLPEGILRAGTSGLHGEEVVMCAVMVEFLRMVNGVEYGMDEGKEWVVLGLQPVEESASTREECEEKKVMGAMEECVAGNLSPTIHNHVTNKCYLSFLPKPKSYVQKNYPHNRLAGPHRAHVPACADYPQRWRYHHYWLQHR